VQRGCIVVACSQRGAHAGVHATAKKDDRALIALSHPCCHLDVETEGSAAPVHATETTRDAGPGQNSDCRFQIEPQFGVLTLETVDHQSEICIRKSEFV